jgi:hypothetical protein
MATTATMAIGTTITKMAMEMEMAMVVEMEMEMAMVVEMEMVKAMIVEMEMVRRNRDIF